MPPEVVIECLVLAEPQTGSYDFYHPGDRHSRLGIGLRLRTGLPFKNRWQSIINQTKTCDNEIVQVYGIPPQSMVIDSSEEK